MLSRLIVVFVQVASPDSAAKTSMDPAPTAPVVANDTLGADGPGRSNAHRASWSGAMPAHWHSDGASCLGGANGSGGGSTRTVIAQAPRQRTHNKAESETAEMAAAAKFVADAVALHRQVDSFIRSA
jgi:hypothetical protein